jgi:hypothetical protein
MAHSALELSISPMMAAAAMEDHRFANDCVSAEGSVHTVEYNLLDTSVKFYRGNQGYGFITKRKGCVIADGFASKQSYMFEMFVQAMPHYISDDDKLQSALTFNFGETGFSLNWCESNLCEEGVVPTECFDLLSGTRFYVEKHGAIWSGYVIHKGVTYSPSKKYIDIDDLVAWVEINDRQALQQALAGSCMKMPIKRSLQSLSN